MKKITSVLITFALSYMAWAQRPLDTLYANGNHTVALFFPNPIEKAVTGHGNFIFSYDREREGHLGLLQGVEGVQSNLLVITTDGKVYAYILEYAGSPTKLNHFVSEEDRIGEQYATGRTDGRTDTISMDNVPNENMERILLDSLKKNRATQRKRGMRLRLEDIIYRGDSLYLVFGIQNRSGIDFEVDLLEVLRVNGGQG